VFRKKRRSRPRRERRKMLKRSKRRSILALTSLVLVGSLAGACQTPAILDPNAPVGPHDCETDWYHCVDGDMKTTGFCCPDTTACGGAPGTKSTIWPNVGCAVGTCCPTIGGGVSGDPLAMKRPLPQRPVRNP
jgi:hypothetical protein